MTQILRLQPEQNEVTAHVSTDSKIMSEEPASAASAPFRPRPAVSTKTGPVLATAAGKISGLDSDCKTKECAMGKVIADALRWRVSNSDR